MTGENIAIFPKIFGLLAEKPSRYSYLMHNAAIKYHNLDSKYLIFKNNNTEDFLSAAKKIGISGLSLTIPHKERGLLICDSVDEHSRIIGAINTIINNNGVLIGHNTDWMGIVSAFEEKKIDIQDATALIVGAGGAARAAIYSIYKLGVKKIFITNRTPERALKLVDFFRQQLNIDIEFVESTYVDKIHDLNLIINMTPFGSELYPDVTFPLSLEGISNNTVVFDAVTAETPLLKHALSMKMKCVSGFDMLVHQAVHQFKLFASLDISSDLLREALSSEVSREILYTNGNI